MKIILSHDQMVEAIQLWFDKKFKLGDAPVAAKIEVSDTHMPGGPFFQISTTSKEKEDDEN